MKQEDEPDTLHLCRPGTIIVTVTIATPITRDRLNGTGYKNSHYKDKKPDAIGVQMVYADDPDDRAIPTETNVKSPEDGTIWNNGYY